MSKIADLFKELNIPKEKLEDVSTRLQANPMAALSLVQELNIPPAVLQQLMAIVMSNPGEIMEFAKEIGIKDDQLNEVQSQIDSVKDRLKGNPQS